MGSTTHGILRRSTETLAYNKELHTKFVVRDRRIQEKNIDGYIARLTVCGNKEASDDTNCLSPDIDYTIIKLLLCLKIQKGLHEKYFNIQYTFPNGIIDCQVYTELQKRYLE